jgi:hypothetical protein
MFAICLQTKKIENKIVGKPCKTRKSLCKHFCKQYKVGIRANFFIIEKNNKILLYFKKRDDAFKLPGGICFRK